MACNGRGFTDLDTPAFHDRIPDAKAGFLRKIELEEPLRNAAQTPIGSIAYKAR